MSGEAFRPSSGDPAAVGAPPSGERGGYGGSDWRGRVVSGGRLLAGRYRLESVIGRGAMGAVWAATDEVPHRRVAIKQVTIAPGLPMGEAAQRSLREARAVAALSSLYIITVFDVLTVDGDPVIVMELLPSRVAGRGAPRRDG